MVPDVRSSGGDLGGEFTMNSPAGVVGVLAAIAASSIPQGERNELRDLVFLYTRGGDEEVKSSLLTQLEAYSIIQLKSANAVDATNLRAPFLTTIDELKVQPKHFQSRPVPQFTLPVVLAKPVPTGPLTVPIFTPAKHNVASEIMPAVSEPVRMVMDTPEVEAIPTNSSPIQPAIIESVTARILALPDKLVELTGDARVARIQEIKTAVNSAFGNPVNLVDSHNALGREYMSALLDAMKLNPSAEVAVVSSVMERLETVFKSIESQIELTGTGSNSLPTTVTPIAVTAVEVGAVGDFELGFVPPLHPPLHPPSISPPRIVPIPVRMRAVLRESSSDVPPLPTVEMVHPVSTAFPITEFDLSPIVTVKNPTRAEETSVVRVSMQSVADNPILKTLADLPSADALERSSVEGDDLFTKDVDDGLDQLLSEWPLFKKSGLFGTGPKGHLHPLFIKLAALQIPLIMSGRFEGSSEEVKQSISDYMNGWRYEQGIIFENNETFEHYLRRVIRHIIDLQKKQRRS